MSVKVPLVSVAFRAVMEQACVRLEDHQENPKTVISRGIDEWEVIGRLHPTRQVAQLFLTRPYAQPCNRPHARTRPPDG